jgi:ABC-2 type transport system permease protein
MFTHIYFYKLKCLTRDKQMLFWTLLFPILLAILFELSLSNITSGEIFNEIEIAVVENTEFRQNINFQSVLSSVSDSKISKEKSLFNIKYTTKEEADKLLSDKKIEGYIYFENGIKLIVKKSGLNQTIIKGFLDDYMQTTSTIITIINENPSVVHNGLIKDVADRKDYLKEVTADKAEPDTIVHYFYTLIAMACLYGSFWGLKEVVAVQADQSAQGARVNIAPTHKLKVFAVSMLAAVTIQLLEIFILLLFLIFGLKVDFGNQLGYIALTCIAGTFTGVTFGAFIAAVVKTGEGLKIGILIGTSMIMTFLAGMMYAGMKQIIRRNVPVLSYLNPANLISDSFYSLYFYNTHTQYFINLILICCFTVLFSFLTYLVLRRQKYASI